MSGPDPSQRARGADREAAIDLIEAAFRAGRIGSADRTIRKNNVATAATVGELDLITRDLAGAGEAATQWPTEPAPEWPTRPTAEPAPALPTDEPLWTPDPATVPPDRPWPADPIPQSPGMPAGVVRPRRSTNLPLLVAMFVLFDLAVVVGLFVSGTVGPGVNFGGDDDSATVEAVEVGDPYALSVAGVGGAIDEYAARFGTTRTLGATFYDDYAIFDVPVGDWTRHATWILRDGSFTQMLDQQANTPFQQPLDLGRLDVAAMMRSVNKARRTLGVDDPGTAYAIVGYDSFTDGPAVSVHVSSSAGDSGHLVTTLDGTLIRKYPVGG